MSRNAVEEIVEAFRAGASDLRERSGETLGQIAESVNHVLDEAGAEGVKIKRTLLRNWTTLERPSRRRGLPVVLALLGVGAAAAYLARRAAAAARG